MGKGKGMNDKKSASSAIKNAKKEAKRAAREAKGNSGAQESSKKPAAPKPQSISTQETFLKAPHHAKWPALFKRHLGVIQTHMQVLDRVMKSMKSEMASMSEEQREEFESKENGHWRRICGMMDRTREVHAQAREVARGVLPEDRLRDKKGLGVKLTAVQEKEEKVEKEDGGDEDSEMEDVPDPSNNSEESDAPSGVNDSDSKRNNLDSSRPTTNEPQGSEGGIGATAETKTAASEPNPYFIIDTEPMPINNLPILKKEKRRSKEDGEEVTKRSKKAKKAKKTDEQAATPEVQTNEESKKTKASQAVPESTESAEKHEKSKKRSFSDTNEEVKQSKKPKPAAIELAEMPSLASNVDFAAIQRQLQAEVQAAEAKKAEKAKKKRRRSSGEGVEATKKART